MTKKLPTNVKKFRAMVRGLKETWNCERGLSCNGCPFYINTDNKQAQSIMIHTNAISHCGAIAIRDVATKFFKQNNPSMRL